MYGRDEQTWEELIAAGSAFLVERAKLPSSTTYTELDAVLVRRTGRRGFKFEHPEERAAMGYLLGRIVENDYPRSGCMISALVWYLDENDAGPGFYKLATEMGLLHKGASATEKERFWSDQVRAVQQHYAKR